MRSTVLALCLLTARASHAELTIFEVQRNLAMAAGEKVYHDYYVDGGREAGLKTGMVLTVQRRSPLFDYYRNREVADLQLDVAKVKVIQVQDNLAVVRLKEDLAHADFPISDDHYIMIGDHLDLSNSVAEAAPAPATVTEAAPVAEPTPSARIVVNSVELSIDDAKKNDALIAAPVAPAAEPTLPASTTPVATAPAKPTAK